MTRPLKFALTGETRYRLGKTVHRQARPDEAAGEFNLETTYSAGTMPGFHLALPTRWQMVYCSCEGFINHSAVIYQLDADCQPLLAVLSGPRGIRTLGLLNAIETRSQLRYRPLPE